MYALADIINNANEWQLIEASLCGWCWQEMDGILAVLAAILHIADIKFIPDPSSDGVLIENENILSLSKDLTMQL